MHMQSRITLILGIMLAIIMIAIGLWQSYPELELPAEAQQAATSVAAIVAAIVAQTQNELNAITAPPAAQITVIVPNQVAPQIPLAPAITNAPPIQIVAAAPPIPTLIPTAQPTLTPTAEIIYITATPIPTAEIVYITATPMPDIQSQNHCTTAALGIGCGAPPTHTPIPPTPLPLPIDHSGMGGPAPLGITPVVVQVRPHEEVIPPTPGIIKFLNVEGRGDVTARTVFDGQQSGWICRSSNYDGQSFPCFDQQIQEWKAKYEMEARP